MSGSRGSERRGGGPACPALRAIAGTRALRRGCRKALGALGQRATALPKAPAAAGSQSGSDATVQAAVTVHWIPRSLKGAADRICRRAEHVAREGRRRVGSADGRQFGQSRLEGGQTQDVGSGPVDSEMPRGHRVAFTYKVQGKGMG